MSDGKADTRNVQTSLKKLKQDIEKIAGLPMTLKDPNPNKDDSQKNFVKPDLLKLIVGKEIKRVDKLREKQNLVFTDRNSTYTDNALQAMWNIAYLSLKLLNLPFSTSYRAELLKLTKSIERNFDYLNESKIKIPQIIDEKTKEAGKALNEFLKNINDEQVIENSFNNKIIAFFFPTKWALEELKNFQSKLNDALITYETNSEEHYDEINEYHAQRKKYTDPWYSNRLNLYRLNKDKEVNLKTLEDQFKDITTNPQRLEEKFNQLQTDITILKTTKNGFQEDQDALITYKMSMKSINTSNFIDKLYEFKGVNHSETYYSTIISSWESCLQESYRDLKPQLMKIIEADLDSGNNLINNVTQKITDAEKSYDYFKAQIEKSKAVDTYRKKIDTQISEFSSSQTTDIDFQINPSTDIQSYYADLISKLTENKSKLESALANLNKLSPPDSDIDVHVACKTIYHDKIQPIEVQLKETNTNLEAAKAELSKVSIESAQARVKEIGARATASKSKTESAKSELQQCTTQLKAKEEQAPSIKASLNERIENLTRQGAELKEKINQLSQYENILDKNENNYTPATEIPEEDLKILLPEESKEAIKNYYEGYQDSITIWGKIANTLNQRFIQTVNKKTNLLKVQIQNEIKNLNRENNEIQSKVGSLRSELDLFNTDLNKLTTQAPELERNISICQLIEELDNAELLIAESNHEYLQSNLDLAKKNLDSLNELINTGLTFSNIPTEVEKRRERLQKEYEELKEKLEKPQIVNSEIKVVPGNNEITHQFKKQLNDSKEQNQSSVPQGTTASRSTKIEKIITEFYGKEGKVKGKVNTYLEQRAKDYFLIDFISKAAAFLFGCFGYKTDSEERNDFLNNDLKGALEEYKKDPSTNYNGLLNKISEGQEKFPERPILVEKDEERTLNSLLGELEEKLKKIQKSVQTHEAQTNSSKDLNPQNTP